MGGGDRGGYGGVGRARSANNGGVGRYWAASAAATKRASEQLCQWVFSVLWHWTKKNGGKRDRWTGEEIER